MIVMRYSFGISDRRKKMLGKKTSQANLTKSFAPMGLERYKNFKKYSAHEISRRDNKNASGKRNGVKKIFGDPEFKKKARKVIYIFIGVLFFLGCVGLILLGLYLRNIQKSLPSPDKLVERVSDQSTQILDKDGNLLYTVYKDHNRKFIPIDQIPDHTKWALLAAEDIEFYQHKGLDYLGIIKSAILNLQHKRVVRGASTITQQLVKNTILYDVLGDDAYKQTLSRKIQEVLITMQVEQTFTKDQILQMYMNEIPLGGVNYGFQAAANAYFNKDVSELTLAESALISGLIQSPGVYSPLYGTKPEMAEERKEYVLGQMEKHQNLTGIGKEEIDAARDEELTYSSKKIDIKAPHFVFYVKQLLEEEFGADRVERGGLKVTTTLDPTLQSIAEEEVVKSVDSAKRFNANNGAMVVLNPKNGQILAMVGSVDYWNTTDPRVDGNVNIVTSERQMGSSVKPFVYLNAITKGYNPGTLAPDISEIAFGNYDPNNWDGKNLGLMTARKALVLSRNTPTVYMLQLGGIDGYIQLMQKFGVDITSKANYGLSIGLGSAEMKLLDFAGAYAVLANSGVKHDITSILKVEDNKGNILKEYKDSEGTRVLDEKEAYLVNWMICDMQGFHDRYGDQYFYINGKKVCGKTGTTDGPKDLDAFLYNQSLVVGVWNGNNNGEIMPNAWSSTVSLVMANSFFKRVIDSYSEFAFNRPAGIMTTTVCTDTGATPAEGVECPKEATLYISGKAPQTDDRKVVEVCQANNLIPSNLDAARKYGLITTKVLLSTTLENALQREAYKKHLLEPTDSIYLVDNPETGLCPLPLGEDNAPVVELISPASGGEVKIGKMVEITGNVRYLESITEFKVSFDGKNVAASLNADGSYVIHYTVPPTTQAGDVKIVVTAKDNYGKVGTASVTLKAVDTTPTPPPSTEPEP
jgi:membrane peptidoglycan carboxypeptidase